MKMTPILSMISSHKQFFFRICLWTIVILCGLLAVAIIVTALRGNTTLLGDPYYEDQIMAWQRAFAPWAFTWMIVVLSVILAMIRPDHKKPK